MSKYIKPQGNKSRSVFIIKAATTAQQDKAQGKHYISDATLAVLIALIPIFQEKLLALNNTLSGREKEIREKNAALAILERYVRDLWEVLKRRVIRLNQPAEVLTFYELPLSGEVPKITKQEEWLLIAREVIDGDADAVTAGYPAMVNPSAAELTTVFQNAFLEDSQVAPADRAYDDAQAEMAEQAQQADAVIEEVMAELRFNLRNLDAPSQRRIMRSYGARFITLPGEPPEEGVIETDVDGNPLPDINE